MKVHVLTADDGCDAGEHIRIVAVYASEQAADARCKELADAVADDNRARAEIVRRFWAAIRAAGGCEHGQERHPERIRLLQEMDEELRRLAPPPALEAEALPCTTYSVVAFDVIEAAAASQ